MSAMENAFRAKPGRSGSGALDVHSDGEGQNRHGLGGTEGNGVGVGPPWVTNRRCEVCGPWPARTAGLMLSLTNWPTSGVVLDVYGDDSVASGELGGVEGYGSQIVSGTCVGRDARGRRGYVGAFRANLGRSSLTNDGAVDVYDCGEGQRYGGLGRTEGAGAGLWAPMGQILIVVHLPGPVQRACAMGLRINKRLVSNGAGNLKRVNRRTLAILGRLGVGVEL
ncbi:hypothetical protein D9611_010568 [Ephemerocybe angulata]|uniref:Uncharacterized protein n=1 Tax=Ephemerocybe angulata TaxID=980116 RepID=A0A8H5FB72_9AGAR|nr:hypothetical protein D9611_010568 [Tulosesus angulatus]